MLFHYLKIAFRNMWKYKSQTLISLIGLAVGFTCFALATLWMVYEMTYDNFHKNAKHKYVVYLPSPSAASGYTRSTPEPLAEFLKETFPEIADAAPLMPSLSSRNISIDGVIYPVLMISADSSFFRMFDVKILEGTMDFLIPGSKKVAITRQKALQLYGKENPIGKFINVSDEICAIVSDMPKRSNYAFDFIRPFFEMNPPPSSQSSRSTMPFTKWTYASRVNTIIELFPGINVEAFEKKLYEIETDRDRGNLRKMKITPLTKMRYVDPDIDREVKFQHILIFSISGLLVIFCSLFNYLTLLVSRFRMRQKELALRVVCGASGRSLMTMLSIEFIFTLLSAVLLGYVLTFGVHKTFLSLSNISMNLPIIYRELLLYIGGVMLISLFLFWIILYIFRRRSLNVSIRRSKNNVSRKISVISQLVIGIGFVFCTVILLKQMHFLHHASELGFSFKNRGSINFMEISGSDENVWANRLKQIPEITEIVELSTIVRNLSTSTATPSLINEWDDKLADTESIELSSMYVTPEFIAFYDFQLIAGEMLTEADPTGLSNGFVLLNESAVKKFGWHDPVGKTFKANRGNFTVKGVIKNIYNTGPAIPAKPIYYEKLPSNYTSQIRITINGVENEGRSINILFKYQEGTWSSCQEKIKQMCSGSGIYSTTVNSLEEEYEKHFRSENALIKLLYFVSAICILICVFGFVSLVSLTLEERRKSIAIRKINGATSGNILAIFAKEYSLLLLIGSVVALSAGYFIMQRWLEQYVKQTSIPVWIYLSITCVFALIIVLCVGWQVWKASVENPSEVVKMN